jgi:hypothetical protein
VGEATGELKKIVAQSPRIKKKKTHTRGNSSEVDEQNQSRKWNVTKNSSLKKSGTI